MHSSSTVGSGGAVSISRSVGLGNNNTCLFACLPAGMPALPCLVASRARARVCVCVCESNDDARKETTTLNQQSGFAQPEGIQRNSTQNLPLLTFKGD